MNRVQLQFAIIFLVLLIVAAGCSVEEEGPTVSTAGDQTVSVNYDFGVTPQDVYFVFTNAGSATTTGTFWIKPSAQTYSTEQSKTTSFGLLEEREKRTSLLFQTSKTSPILKDRPGLEIPELTSLQRSERSPLQEFIPGEPQLSTIGESYNFLDLSTDSITTVSIPATLKEQVTDSSNGMTLNLWVADSSWGAGCTDSPCMDATMLSAFAAKFLKEGADNDIYDWVTNIFGTPWGSHQYYDLIPQTASSQIDILFFDIKEKPGSSGTISGFYWPKDNFIQSGTGVASLSNERLMFYIDSVLAATSDGGTWDISHSSPMSLVGTLAHEFQHMINFYQKSVKNNANLSEVWLNEMCSEMAEDFVARKLQINGPRGVLHSDPSVGTANNEEGRLPAFNYFNDLSLTQWIDGSAISYSLVYAFGAYLARNYGGAPLFQKIVQNPYADEQAIISALDVLGNPRTFKYLLENWGAAVIKSNLVNPASNQIYNANIAGDWFNSVIGSTTYSLGSINLFNYTLKLKDEFGEVAYTQEGPAFWNFNSANRLKTFPHSNTLALAGTSITGERTWEVTMPAGVSLTVVSKNSY